MSENPTVVAVGEAPIVRPTFGPAVGCERLEQSVLTCAPGSTVARDTGACEEVLYVLRGVATLRVDDTERALSPADGVSFAPAQRYAITADSELEIVSVRLPDPVVGTVVAATVVTRAEQERGAATAGREFRLVSGPESGCHSATQFVGVIPPGRAPVHYHHYDEVIYVLEGSGVLHLASGDIPVHPGSCIHLPARLHHSLENAGDAPLEVLGVFRPAGSPSEAYYPDGTPAMNQNGENTR